MKKLTIICPAYNEADGVKEFYTTLKEELLKLNGYSSSILFVVDGGTDRTFSILKELAKLDSTLQIIKFTHNFGHQKALLAGIDYATGDVVITMDSDLQHPPSLIPILLSEYEKGNDVVLTIRKEAGNIGIFRKIAGKIFYRFVHVISDTPIHENASDFRLLSLRVVDVLRNTLQERDMFLRGAINWTGFKQSLVHYSAHQRFAGKSKYSFGRLASLALSGAVSFSKKPLRISSVLGVVIALCGFLYAFYTVLEFFLGGTPPPGWTTVIALLLIFGGVQLMVLGILGEYIGVIFDEVKKRPRYVIDEVINFSPIHKRVEETNYK